MRNVKAMLHRCCGLLTLSLLTGYAFALSDQELQAYLALDGYKAMASTIGQPRAPAYTSANQSNELAAANEALASCQQQAPQAQNCELIWLNNQALTTGASLRARATGKPHPLFLWRFIKGNSTLYLAGSVHLLKPSTYPLPEQLELAFAQSNTLVLEVNLNSLSPAALQEAFAQRALLTDGSKLSQHLPAALNTQLTSQLSRYGINLQSLSKLKPAAVTQQLVMLRLLTLGYPSNSGVEQHFLGKLNGRRVQGLETIEEQLDLLLNQPMPVQIAMLQTTLDQMDLADQQMSSMVHAWLTGNDEQILAEFKTQAGSSAAAKQFYEQLLDRRNVKMASKIQQLLEVPGTHMVLIGAAHYPGHNGIVNLLSKRGLNGERIWSNQQVLPSKSQSTIH